MANQLDFSKGWVQRAARHQYQEGELVDALNCLPTGQGAIESRLGSILVGSTSQADVHSLWTAYNAQGGQIRYQGAGTSLYRNFVQIVTGLPGGRISFATMRGFGEQETYTFFAGNHDLLRVKDNGVLTKWGLSPPTVTTLAGIGSGTGALNGQYAWKQIYVRKPAIAPSYGPWTYTTGLYTLFTPPTLLQLSTNNVNDGFVAGGPQPSGELVFNIITASVGASAYDYYYWGGQGWVPFTPTQVPNFAVLGVTRLSYDFPASNWVPVGGIYLILVRATTPPGTAAVANVVQPYDSVYAARSNASPTMLAGVSVSPGVSYNIGVANPFVPGLDFDPQVTHVAVYRTKGNDPAWTSGAGVNTLLYYFEGDVPVGSGTFRSYLDDDALGELLETDNDRPPVFTTVTEHQDRIFGAIGNRLYFSKRFFPEAFPPSNYVEVAHLGDPILRIEQYDGNLFLFTAGGIYLLLGNDETSYDPRRIQCPVGLGAIGSVARGERGIYFFGSDGNLWQIQGTSVAINISHETHYQFFHGITLYGVTPLSQAFRSGCAGCWANQRYYLTYPTGALTVPNAMLMLDEQTMTWWRDSRGYRALHYDRLHDDFYGGKTNGRVVLLEIGTTDDEVGGIACVVQTRDEDEGAPDQDKELVQLTVDSVTFGLPMTVETVQDYNDALPVPLGTVTTGGHVQTVLPTPAAGGPRAKAFGYKLTGTAPLTIYRLIPHNLVFPAVLRAWDSLPTNLGHPGLKIVSSELLDLELQSGVLTSRVYVDGVLVELQTVSTPGRSEAQVISYPRVGTIVQTFLACTGTFLLYGDPRYTWEPQPLTFRAWSTRATDLGYAGPKHLESLLLDLDVLSGVLTIETFVDSVLVETSIVTPIGRSLFQAITQPHDGTIFQWVLTCTGTFLLYEDSTIGWRRMPPPLYDDALLPTDMGTPLQKLGLAYYLDVELLSPGLLTTTFLTDGVVRHTLPYETVGRVRSQRHRLPASMRGRLFEVRRQSTALYRLWSGTEIELRPVGGRARQTFRLADQRSEERRGG